MLGRMFSWVNGCKKRKKTRTIEEILGVLREHLPGLREQYKVKTLGVFGSYVHGEQGKRSDLDVLVEFEHAPTFFEFIDLEDHLSELLGVKVDLVMRSALRPAIGRRILAEARAV